MTVKCRAGKCFEEIKITLTLRTATHCYPNGQFIQLNLSSKFARGLEVCFMNTITIIILRTTPCKPAYAHTHRETALSDNYIHEHTANPQANLEGEFNSIKLPSGVLGLTVRRVRVI